ncbi:MAG: GntR family transcriptional regulator [Spirochaetota bacterium]
MRSTGSEQAPLFHTIARGIEDRLLAGSLREGDRLESVREFAIELEVNVNTCLRAYQLLESRGYVEMRRGLGYFVAAGGKQAVLAQRRREFAEREVPRLRQIMELLDIDYYELERLLEEAGRRGR